MAPALSGITQNLGGGFLQFRQECLVLLQIGVLQARIEFHTALHGNIGLIIAFERLQDLREVIERCRLPRQIAIALPEVKGLLIVTLGGL